MGREALDLLAVRRRVNPDPGMHVNDGIPLVIGVKGERPGIRVIRIPASAKPQIRDGQRGYRRIAQIVVALDLSCPVQCSKTFQALADAMTVATSLSLAFQ